MSTETESKPNRTGRVLLAAIIGGIVFGPEGALAGAALGLLWPMKVRSNK